MEPTLTQLTTPSRQVTLPCGKAFTVAQVTVPRWQAMLTAFGDTCRAIQSTLDHPLTADDLREQVPAALLDAWTLKQSEEVAALLALSLDGGTDIDAANGLVDNARALVDAARAGVLEFLGFFVPGLAAEDLDALSTLGDWAALWQEVYADNAIPFVRRLGHLRRSRELASLMLNSASGSTEPESTPGTPA